MDYLNLLTTRRVILFAPPSPLDFSFSASPISSSSAESPSLSSLSLHDPNPDPDSSPNSPMSSPTTPIRRFSALPPAPISIPLDAFYSGGRTDCDLAYFLTQHVLDSWNKGAAWGDMPDNNGPDKVREAEEVAWVEVYKAKRFVVELASRWGRDGQGEGVGEGEMKRMARAQGLVLGEVREE